MKTKGRRQSGNVIDASSDRGSKQFQASVSSVRNLVSRMETVYKDAQRAIPKRAMGFDEDDMEESARRHSVDRIMSGRSGKGPRRLPK